MHFAVRAEHPGNASIAQLVERDLAKVEVTSSNLVTRSKFTTTPPSGGVVVSAIYFLLSSALS